MQPRHFCIVVHPFSSHDLGSIFITLYNKHTSFHLRFVLCVGVQCTRTLIRYVILLYTFPVNSWNTLQNTFCPCLILVYKLNTQHKGSQLLCAYISHVFQRPARHTNKYKIFNFLLCFLVRFPSLCIAHKGSKFRARVALFRFVFSQQSIDVPPVPCRYFCVPKCKISLFARVFTFA